VRADETCSHHYLSTWHGKIKAVRRRGLAALLHLLSQGGCFLSFLMNSFLIFLRCVSTSLCMSVGDETAALFTFTSITPVCYTLHIGSHEDIYERTLQIQSEPATERTANPKHQDREHTTHTEP
jgi:hypothetical protein